jgi:hypothetical protein
MLLLPVVSVILLPVCGLPPPFLLLPSRHVAFLQRLGTGVANYQEAQHRKGSETESTSMSASEDLIHGALTRDSNCAVPKQSKTSHRGRACTHALDGGRGTVDGAAR